MAAGAVCRIPSGVKRTPQVHSPSSSYSMFLNRTEQSWSASLFGLNFLTNSGSLLEFDALHDHSHCTTGLFAKHRRKTDSPAATCTPRDNCTNSTIKGKRKLSWRVFDEETGRVVQKSIAVVVTRSKCDVWNIFPWRNSNNYYRIVAKLIK